MENGSEKQEMPEKPYNPLDFFLQDRGERALYESCSPLDEIPLPLTRDGYEAMIFRACNQFTPALPVDDSTRKVFSGWVHHISNDKNTSTIQDISKVLYKSIVNALTWTIDQEIKQKQQKEHNERALKAQAEANAKAKEEAVAKRETKQAKKASRRMTIVQKNETKKG